MSTTRIKDTIKNEMLLQRGRDKLSCLTVAIFLQDKEQRRRSKNQSFHCYSLRDNLEYFLNEIKKSDIEQYDTVRFQVVLLTGSIHRCALDIQFQHGRPSFYIIDAANDLSKIYLVFRSIYQTYPQATCWYTPGEIQFNDKDCTFFSLDHAFCLSKIADLHSRLPSLVQHGKYQRYIHRTKSVEVFDDTSQYLLARAPKFFDQEEIALYAKHVKLVPVGNFPAEWGMLIRNMQFAPSLQAFFSRNVTLRGNSNKTLKEYVEPFLLKQEDGSMQNVAIERKISNILKKGKIFLNSLTEKKCRDLSVSLHVFDLSIFSRSSADSSLLNSPEWPQLSGAKSLTCDSKLIKRGH